MAPGVVRKVIALASFGSAPVLSTTNTIVTGVLYPETDTIDTSIIVRAEVAVVAAPVVVDVGAVASL